MISRPRPVFSCYSYETDQAGLAIPLIRSIFTRPAEDIPCFAGWLVMSLEKER